MTKLIRESLRDLVRHKLSSILLSFVIALSILCLGAILTVLFNLDKIEQRWSEDIRIIIFPSKGIEGKELLIKDINSINGISKLQYVSSDEAAGILRKRFPDEDVFFSSTVMPDFIEVTVSSDQVERIVFEIKKNQNVDDVIVNYSWLKSLKEVLSIIKYSAALGISFVLLLSLLLLSYSARIDAIQRKKEMDILRLCGATEWYVRFPYIFGGCCIGFLGSIIGISMFYILKTAFQGVIIHFSSVFVSSFNYADMPFLFWILLFLLGPLLGGAGHLFAFFSIKLSENDGNS